MIGSAMMTIDPLEDFAARTRPNGIRKVLILSDEASGGDMLRKLCRDSGYRVCLCRRAEEVSSLCVNCDPDLVILDYSRTDATLVDNIKLLRLDLPTGVPMLVFFPHLIDIASEFYSRSIETFYLLRPRRAEVIKQLIREALSDRKSF